MDKELLFEFLKTKFMEAGFSEGECNLQISRLESRYADMSDDAIDADLRARGGASRFAAAIILRRNTVLLRDPEYKRFAENSGSRIPPLHDMEEADAYLAKAKAQDKQRMEKSLIEWFASDEKVSETEALPTKANMRKPTAQRVPRTAAAAVPKPVTSNQATAVPPATPTPRPTPAAKEAVPAQTAPTATAKHELGNTRIIDMPAARKPLSTPVFSAERVQDDRSAEKKNVRKGKNERPQKKVQLTEKKPIAESKVKQPKTTLADITYWGEGTEEGYRRFRTYFWLSLPLVIVLLAAIAVIFLGVIALLGAMIAALAVLLVGEVAVGSALSIVGVIYGVSQLFVSMPVGLFELGIAVTVLGATMLLGIIIYNLAVRFLPFVLKKFFRFIRFFIAFLQDLYYYLKGECYRR